MAKFSLFMIPSAGVDPPSSRDPPIPFAVTASNKFAGLSLDAKLSSTNDGNNSRNGGLALADIISQIQASKDSVKSSALTSYSDRRAPERLQQRRSIEDLVDFRDSKRHFDREGQIGHVPNFQRPLSRKNTPGRVSLGRRKSLDDSHLNIGETPSYIEGPSSLTDALTEGLSSTSDWRARVAAFNYIRSSLLQGPRGIQEVVQSFEKVMKLFFQHIDDPHHKVAQAALLSLIEIIPSCRKPFEGYMERILPHVFSRLIDPKELVRQPCSSALDIVGKTYGADTLLPAFLRSLDEQRSPKAKLAVIEFANKAFKRHLIPSEGAGNLGILKLWLAKLTPLVHEKNTKLKETATTCFISVYTHYDPTAVLGFILSLSVEEQNSLRRALKQYTPRIEVDLMNFIQSKKDRQRNKTSYDPYDVVGTSSEEGYAGISKKSHFVGRQSAGSFDGEGFRKWNSASDDVLEHGQEHFEAGYSSDVLGSKIRDLKYTETEHVGAIPTSHFNVDALLNYDHLETPGFSPAELEVDDSLSTSLKMTITSELGPSVPQILHSIGNGNEGKHDGLQQLIEVSISNDQSIWTKYFNQILTAVLEVLNDSESSVRELALSLLAQMLNNQKGSMEDSIEIVVEKLLHISKDRLPKVADEAENCLAIVLSQYDPIKCLNVVVPLLATEDEKMLVTCINCLTKLVGRLSQEELTVQLPSFLPSIFDAFDNQSADVRKTVVFCLVDIYIMLGKTFLPYLEGLNSTQLRLVTIYANRISQARTGAPIDATHS